MESLCGMLFFDNQHQYQQSYGLIDNLRNLNQIPSQNTLDRLRVLINVRNGYCFFAQEMISDRLLSWVDGCDFVASPYHRDKWELLSEKHDEALMEFFGFIENKKWKFRPI